MGIFIRWFKAFIVYFCIVVTLHSLIEFLYAGSIFQMPMIIMGVVIPSAYVYGLTLGLVLSVAHFVLGKTIQRGRDHIIREHLATSSTNIKLPETKKKKTGRKGKKK